MTTVLTSYFHLCPGCIILRVLLGWHLNYTFLLSKQLNVPTSSIPKNLFSHTSRQWNSLPRTWFPHNYNLQKFECNVNRHLLAPWSPFFFSSFPQSPPLYSVFSLTFTLCNPLRTSSSPTLLEVKCLELPPNKQKKPQPFPSYLMLNSVVLINTR